MKILMMILSFIVKNIMCKNYIVFNLVLVFSFFITASLHLFYLATRISSTKGQLFYLLF